MHVCSGHLYLMLLSVWCDCAMAEATQSHADVSIRTDFSGGNVQVTKIDGDDVFVTPDLRGGRDWFYWCFEVETTRDRQLRFVFPDRQMKFISMQGPAVSSDSGKTWDWLGADTVSGSSFQCAVKANTKLRLAVTIPYLQSNLNQLVAACRSNSNVVVSELTKTRKGRPVELLRIGAPAKGRIPILMTARHHACETMASYLLDGFLRAAMSDDENGKAFREKYVLYCVPMVDKDGVEDGDQGKNRNPHDHNRDYIDQPIFPAVKAIMKLGNEKRFQIAVDFHCPTLWMDYHQVIYFVGPKDSPAPNHANVTHLAKLIKEDFPQTAPRGCLVMLKSGRTPGHFSDHFAHKKGMMMAMTLEFPYASPGKTMTPKACVDYGRSLLRSWNRAQFEDASTREN